MRRWLIIVAIGGAIAVSPYFFPEQKTPWDGQSVFAKQDGDQKKQEIPFEGRDWDFKDKVDDVDHGVAHAAPHGKVVCASGCAANAHPKRALKKDEFLKLMAEYAKEPVKTEDKSIPTALDQLLYYGRQTRMYLSTLGYEPLDEAHTEFLKKELRVTHAWLEFRVIDDEGVVRVALKKTKVPLEIRYEFHPLEYTNIQRAETSGTLRRTGLYHCWQRI